MLRIKKLLKHLQVTKTCSAQNHCPMFCECILLCKCSLLLVLLPSCASKPGAIIVSFAVSHSTTALREIIATSTANGVFKPLKKKNGKVVEGLPIVCTDLKNGGKQEQGDCGGATAEVFLSPFQQKGGTHLGPLTPSI